MPDNDFSGIKVSIIGLGLIGGSLARALRERAGVKDITAVNPTWKSLQLAMEDGVITRGFTEVNQHVFASDLIFICTPVKRTLEYLKMIGRNAGKNCIITDVGSTKAEIIEYVDGMEDPPCFIGGHPMAGTEKTGYSSSFSHLFENAYYILTPCSTSCKLHVDFLAELVKRIGGIPVIMKAEEHDRITGSISHVPHVIASALVNLVKKAETPDGKMQMLAAGGFKDITRIASSSPEMWESIVSSNQQQIESILNDYIEILEEFKQNMKISNLEGIHDFFVSAKTFRDLFTAGKNGLTSSNGMITPSFELIVDVVDKPGIIGEIATILGNKGVNIKNINVSNSREFEQGCLRITLPDSESVNIAFDLLYAKGYKIYKSN